jgi:hypothetical protein
MKYYINYPTVSSRAMNRYLCQLLIELGHEITKQAVSERDKTKLEISFSLKTKCGPARHSFTPILSLKIALLSGQLWNYIWRRIRH